MLIWGKISIFDTKNLISRYFTTFQLPNHPHLQKMSKIQLYSCGKIQAKQIWLLKYTKTCPKLAVFGHFLIFSVFEVHFLRTLNPKSAFLFIKCGMKYPKWLIFATSVKKTELSNLTKNEIVLPPKHGAPPPIRKACLFLGGRKKILRKNRPPQNDGIGDCGTLRRIVRRPWWPT